MIRLSNEIEIAERDAERAAKFQDDWLRNIRVVYDTKLGGWYVGAPTTSGGAPHGLSWVNIYSTRDAYRAFRQRLMELRPDIPEIAKMSPDRDVDLEQFYGDVLLAREGLLKSDTTDRPGVRYGEKIRAMAVEAGPPPRTTSEILGDVEREAREARRRRAVSRLAIRSEDVRPEDIEKTLEAQGSDADDLLRQALPLIQARRAAKDALPE